MKRYEVVYQTAKTDLLELCEAGLLKKYKQGKVFYFGAADDIGNKLIS